MRILIVAAGLLISPVVAYAQVRPALRAAPRAASSKPIERKTLERLERMSPEQRQKMLDRLPPERAKKLRERLDQYEKLTPQERQQLQSQYNWFSQLPPERQQAMRETYQRFNALPIGRRQAVRREVDRLQLLGVDERTRRVHSRRFRLRYSAEERSLIEEMSNVALR